MDGRPYPRFLQVRRRLVHITLRGLLAALRGHPPSTLLSVPEPFSSRSAWAAAATTTRGEVSRLYRELLLRMEPSVRRRNGVLGPLVAPPGARDGEARL